MSEFHKKMKNADIIESSVWMEVCTVHVKVLLNLMWALLKPHFTNRTLAAMTGSTGIRPLTDNKREELWRLFLCTDIFLFTSLLMIQWRDFGVPLSARPACLPGPSPTRPSANSGSGWWIRTFQWWCSFLCLARLKGKWAEPPALCSSATTHCLWRSIVSVQ